MHGSVQIVGYQRISVAVVVEGFPSGKVQVLGIVGEVHATLQDILASHGGERVQVYADDEIGIVGEEGSKLVV